MNDTSTSTTANKAKDQAKETAATAKASADKAAEAAFEIPTAFRDMAEKTVGQAKLGYDAYKSFAEDATEAMEDTLTTVNKGAGELQRQALVSAKAQMNANFDFAEKLLNAKSLSEAMELQTSFMRQQFDLMSSNAKEFQALATRVQQDTSKPIADNMNKVFGQWRQMA